MNQIITFGSILAFFAGIIYVLHRSHIRDRTFTDYAVAGRSFGGFYQAMAFINTWWPGTTFIAFAGLSAGAGVLGFYALSYSLMTVVLMYVMARRVWIWGAKFNLRTQPDLFSLRYGSKNIRTVAAVIGVLSTFPWIVLGMQSMGLVFSYLSFGEMSITAAVILGVILLAIRQIWTIRMGMRGIVITDMYQGIVAYVVGSVLIVGLIIWLMGRGIGLGDVDRSFFELPGTGEGPGPLYVFALIFTGVLGGWCWPSIFVRLYTADGVRSLKHSAAVGVPLSFVFYAVLTILALLASAVPEVAKAPQEMWFILNEQAGGAVLLALAGVIVFAATMGNIDGNIQATGAQVANDWVGNYRELNDKQLVVWSKIGMVVLTGAAAFIATLQLGTLVTLAILSYQGIIQLAVPQFLGIFWKRGNSRGAIAGMVVGFITAIVLEAMFRDFLPWAAGLTSGVVALAANAAVYVACAYLFPQSASERERVDRLFDEIREPHAQPQLASQADLLPQQA